MRQSRDNIGATCTIMVVMMYAVISYVATQNIDYKEKIKVVTSGFENDHVYNCMVALGMYIIVTLSSVINNVSIAKIKVIMSGFENDHMYNCIVALAMYIIVTLSSVISNGYIAQSLHVAMIIIILLIEQGRISNIMKLVNKVSLIMIRMEQSINYVTSCLLIAILSISATESGRLIKHINVERTIGNCIMYYNVLSA